MSNLTRSLAARLGWSAGGVAAVVGLTLTVVNVHGAGPDLLGADAAEATSAAGVHDCVLQSAVNAPPRTASSLSWYLCENGRYQLIVSPLPTAAPGSPRAPSER